MTDECDVCTSKIAAKATIALCDECYEVKVASAELVGEETGLNLAAKLILEQATNAFARSDDKEARVLRDLSAALAVHAAKTRAKRLTNAAARSHQASDRSQGTKSPAAGLAILPE